MKINAPKIEFSADFKMAAHLVDNQFFAMPLTNEKELYFINSKKFGIETTGTYTFKGLTNTCSPTNKQCLALFDIGRGHFTYHTTWYWASTATYLPDGRSFALNMGDGIGIQHDNTKDKFYEDFVVVDGKHFKLDQTRIEFDPSDYTKVHTFKTLESELRVFKDRKCNLTFEPIGTAKDGVDLSVIGFT